MNQDQTPVTPQEKKTLAMAGFAISAAAFICTFFTGLRSFSIVIAIVGLVISIMTLNKARKNNNPRGLSLAGIVCAIMALGIAAFFLYTQPAAKVVSPGSDLPPELTDSAATQSDDSKALEQLKNIVGDSAEKH